jgi:4-hydroxy-2-oxoheptanedioate aldolase
MNFDATAGEYYAQANDEILVVLQTESPEGVANAEEIYSLPGCDAIFIGPNDLRFQMRSPDGVDPTAEEHEAAVQRVIEVGKQVGTPTGIHVMDVETAHQRAAEGMQFLAVGSELRMMTQQAQEVVENLIPEAVASDVARY